jgi:hypothetical protein
MVDGAAMRKKYKKIRKASFLSPGLILAIRRRTVSDRLVAMPIPPQGRLRQG